MPGGNTLVLPWLLMLTEAGKLQPRQIPDGLGQPPYSAETLSIVTDISLPTVQLGLVTFVGST